jgi:stage III sporulation protein AB
MLGLPLFVPYMDKALPNCRKDRLYYRYWKKRYFNGLFYSRGNPHQELSNLFMMKMKKIFFRNRGACSMKWIGAILFISVTTWLGFEWSNKLSSRPKHIRQLINALQVLEAEILYSQLPLHDAFTSITRQIPEPCASFFQSVAEGMVEKYSYFETVWEACVIAFIEKSSLGSNESEILLQFGRTLGQHDFTQQQKHIQLTIKHLERELQDARDEQEKYGKMAKNLGFLTGLFIVLLLI